MMSCDTSEAQNPNSTTVKTVFFERLFCNLVKNIIAWSYNSTLSGHMKKKTDSTWFVCVLQKCKCVPRWSNMARCSSLEMLSGWECRSEPWFALKNTKKTYCQDTAKCWTWKFSYLIRITTWSFRWEISPPKETTAQCFYWGSVMRIKRMNTKWDFL